MSKGDTRRQTNEQKYRENYDRIFGTSPRPSVPAEPSTGFKDLRWTDEQHDQHVADQSKMSSETPSEEPDENEPPETPKPSMEIAASKPRTGKSVTPIAEDGAEHLTDWYAEGGSL